MSVILGENGGLPTTALANGHLTLTEDGDTIATELFDCNVTNVADIVILLDHSTSMLGIVGNRAKIYEKFYASIGSFIGELPFGSRYCVMPYTDSVTAVYPEQITSEEYYRQGSKQDSIDCIAGIRSLTFYGNTRVDASLPTAATKLAASTAPKKVIVLITDDVTLLPDSIGTELFRNGVKVFVLEVGKENAPTNFRLAQKTGGTYYQAVDTNLYSFYLKRIAEHIKAEHCMLRYTTNKPCPWNAAHTVAVTLDYNTTYKTNWHGYILPYTPNDTTPPIVALTAPTFTSRKISASEMYPCERGIKSFAPIQLSNFSQTAVAHTFPATVTDSLEVIDQFLPAFARYAAIDSAGNSVVKDVYYFPSEDTTEIAPLVFSSGVIDFGKKEAPCDTTVVISVTNPNNKTVSITSESSIGNPNEITSSLSPMIFSPFEEKNFSVRFSSSLLGAYQAQFTLQNDTSVMGTLKVSAQTFGRIHVWIDTATVGSFGDTGSITLRFQAKPNPINFDTIRFTLSYNSDLIEFLPERITCTSGSPLCRYSITPTILSGGKLEMQFIASPESYPFIIDSSDSYIRLPLRTYLSKSESSLLSIDNYFLSRNSLLSYSQGVLSVIDGCGDGILRSFLLDNNSLRITNITQRNDGELSISYESATNDDVYVAVKDILGRTVTSLRSTSKAGKNLLTIPTALSASSYILSIEHPHSRATLPFVVIK